MSHDDINYILFKEEEILPSSGFVASVMDAVRREAAIPPPIPFPWKRALPGLAVAGLALVSVLILSLAQLIRTPTVSPPPASLPSVIASILEVATFTGADWIVLALLLTLSSVMLSMRLTQVKAWSSTDSGWSG